MQKLYPFSGFFRSIFNMFKPIRVSVLLDCDTYINYSPLDDGMLAIPFSKHRDMYYIDGISYSTFRKKSFSCKKYNAISKYSNDTNYILKPMNYKFSKTNMIKTTAKGENYVFHTDTGI